MSWWADVGEVKEKEEEEKAKNEEDKEEEGTFDFTDGVDLQQLPFPHLTPDESQEGGRDSKASLSVFSYNLARTDRSTTAAAVKCLQYLIVGLEGLSSFANFFVDEVEEGGADYGSKQHLLPPLAFLLDQVVLNHGEPPLPPAQTLKGDESTPLRSPLDRILDPLHLAFFYLLPSGLHRHNRLLLPPPGEWAFASALLSPSAQDVLPDMIARRESSRDRASGQDDLSACCLSCGLRPHVVVSCLRLHRVSL
eukprot:759071-Hanusia_phi.AAC.5